MEFKKENHFGVYAGYTIIFFIFTTILYFLLKILGKLPMRWNYLNILLVAIFIILIGKSIKYWLEKP